MTGHLREWSAADGQRMRSEIDWLRTFGWCDASIARRLGISIGERERAVLREQRRAKERARRRVTHGATG